MNYLIPFLILITIVVFIHEYGHYYFARKFGVGVTDFSIGFGKEIFGWNDKSGTRWKFCLIPLGGYVKFFGDRNVFSQAEQEEVIKKYSESDQKKLFILKPLYQRAIIVAAGPLANYLLAILIFTFIFMYNGKDITPSIITKVQERSPAYEAGLKANDKIYSINNKKIESIFEISTIIASSTKNTIEITVIRNSNKINFLVTPKTIKDKDALGNNVNKKIIGIQLSPANNEFEKRKLGITKSFIYSLKEIWFVSITSLKYLGSMIMGNADVSQLGGPIKIAKITGQVAEYGIIPFLNIMAYISVSLGLINLFPIPMLDGGHLMFYFFEKILGRPLTQKTQEFFFRIGLSVLIFLMFFVTFNDIKDLALF